MRTYFYLRKPLFRSPLVALVLISAAMAPGGFANPYGESVVAGNVSFNRTGSTLRVATPNDRAIVNWQGFSINAGETTRFQQPSSDSVFLSRVVSGNPSAIYGNLEANGRIYLINPNGVLVGASGRIDTAGFLASTLDVTDRQFLSGNDLAFSGSSTAAVINRGIIHAVGGDILLFGGTVENSGSLNAGAGAVGLAAGSEILLKQAGDERVAVRPTGVAGGGVTNSGVVEAVQAELKAHGNLYALAINNSGIVRATGAATRGGRVLLTSAGGAIRHSGSITARNGGAVRIDGGAGGSVTVSGQIDASSQIGKGGDVQVLGDSLALIDQAQVNVSGFLGGGTALIGGDLHGANPAVRNALNTFVGQNARITADATASGNGGKVVLWANDATRFYGTLSARGGASGGNGGLAEVSGKHSLDFRGIANLSAVAGAKGTLLMDPDSIDIIEDTGNGDTLLSGTNEIHAGDTPSGMTISWGQIDSIGATANVVLEAQKDITIQDMSTGTIALHLSTYSLTFHSLDGDIAFHNLSDTLQTEGGGITFRADTGSLNLGNLETTGVSGTEGGPGSAGVTLVGHNSVSVRSVTTYGAPIAVTSTHDSVTTGNLTTNGPGPITLKAGSTVTAGAIATTGTLVFSSSLGAALTDAANNFAAVTGTNNGGSIAISNGASSMTIGSLSETGGDVSIQSSGDILLNGALQNLTGRVTLTADSQGTGAGGVRIAPWGQITSVGDVAINGSDLISTGGIVDSIVIDAAAFRPTFNPQIVTEGSTFLNNNDAAPAGSAIRMAGLLYATGTTRFGGPTILQGDALFTGGVAFQSTLDGAKRLTINASGNDVSFNLPVGSNTALKAVAITTPHDVVISGSSSMNADSLNVSGGTGTTFICGPITATNGAVSLVSKDIAFKAEVPEGADPTPMITTSGTGGIVTFDGNVWLTGSNPISIVSGGNIIQRGTISGTNDLSMVADGSRITFNGGSKNLTWGSIGGYQVLKSLTLTADQIDLQPDIRTIGDQTYTTSGTLTRIGGGRFISTAGTLTFNGAVMAKSGATLGAYAPSVVFNGPLTISSGGFRTSADSLSFNGAVNAAGTISLTPGSSTQVVVGGAGPGGPGVMRITDATLQAFATGSVSSLTIGCNNGTVTVQDAVSVPYSLTLTTTGVGSRVVIGAPVETTGPNASLTLSGVTNELNAGLVTHGGALTLKTLSTGPDASLSSNGGPITFASSIDGADSGNSLTVHSGTGNILFKGTVGATTPLALDLQSSGTAILQSKLNLTSLTTRSGGATALYSTLIASDSVSFGNAVKLMGSAIIKAGESVSFADTVSNGSSKRSLAVTSTNGQISFASTVGTSGTAGGGPLSTLTLTSLQSDLTQTGSWNVSGNTTLNAPGQNILLGAHNNFGTLAVTAANATINEDGDLDLGACKVSGDMTLSSLGTIAFRKVIAAGSITTSTTGTTALYATTLLTSGNFTFGNPVKLFVNPTLKAGGAISFQGTVSNGSDSRALTLTATNGAISFRSAVGTSDSPLAALTLTSLSSGFTQGATSPWNVSGLTTFNMAGLDILLNATQNNLGVLRLIGRNATVFENNDTILGTSTISGNLTVNSTASITTASSAGTLKIAGTSRFISDGSITLAATANQFGGAVSFDPAHSGEVLLVNGTNTVLGTMTLGGNLTVNSTGSITSGTSNIGGNFTVTSKGNITLGTSDIGGNLTVTSGANATLGASNISGNLTVNSNGSTAFGDSTVSGNLSVNSVRNLTQSGSLRVNGTASLAITGRYGSIALSRADNALSNLLNVSAPGNIDIRNNVGDLTVSGAVVSASGKVILASTGGDLILASGAAPRVSAVRAILATNQNFLNYSGSNAVAGQYVVYSGNADTVVKGGLGSDSVYPLTPYPSDSELATNVDGHRFYFAH